MNAPTPAPSRLATIVPTTTATKEVMSNWVITFSTLTTPTMDTGTATMVVDVVVRVVTATRVVVIVVKKVVIAVLVTVLVCVVRESAAKARARTTGERLQRIHRMDIWTLPLHLLR